MNEIASVAKTIWTLYEEIAPTIRILSYTVISLVVMLHSAQSLTKASLLVSVIHLFAALFMVSSAFVAYTRDLRVALYITTPIVALLAMVASVYLMRLVRQWISQKSQD